MQGKKKKAHYVFVVFDHDYYYYYCCCSGGGFSSSLSAPFLLITTFELSVALRTDLYLFNSLHFFQSRSVRLPYFL